MGAGVALGLISSITFGLIPLFTLPLLRGGMAAESVLFLRFLFGSILLGGLLLLRGERLAAPPADLARLAVMSLLYMMAALLMFQALSWLPGGVTSTLQFLYPVFVMLVMVLLFREPPTWSAVCAVVLALAGIFLLGNGEGGGVEADASDGHRLLGVILVLISSLCNALYIVGLHKAGPRGLTGLAVTFWVLAFGAVICLAAALIRQRFSLPRSAEEVGLALLLALFTAVISNLTLVLAIRRVGSTLSAILGVGEPPTAVIVGILVFDEPGSAGLWLGMALICLAVLCVMLGPQIPAWLERMRRGRGGSRG